jgi:hypothetical protein
MPMMPGSHEDGLVTSVLDKHAWSWHGHEHVSSVPLDCMHAPDFRILARSCSVCLYFDHTVVLVQHLVDICLVSLHLHFLGIGDYTWTNLWISFPSFVLCIALFCPGHSSPLGIFFFSINGQKH